MMYIAFLAKRTGSELSSAEHDRTIEALNTMKTVLSFSEFPDSINKIDKTIPWVSALPSEPSTLGAELRNVVEFILMEAEKKKFLYVAVDRVSFLENDILLGERVTAAFPHAASDIRDAGNCLAAECNTAAVFHLMRVVEWGLRALCSHLGIKRVRSKFKKSGRVAYTAIEYSEWERILDELQDRVDSKIKRMKRGSSKQKLQQFYYPALQDIRGIRDAWRNHVMHTRDEYSREDAAAIFAHVNRLMVSLADRISVI